MLRCSRAPLRARARYLVLLFALAYLALGSLLAPPAARAQEPDSGGASLELLAQPVSYGADGRLAIRVRVTNDSNEELPGFIVNVGRGGRLTSRFDLQNSFDAPPGFTPWTTPPQVVTRSLAPNQSRVVRLNQAVSTLLVSGTDEEGIYPATVFLLDSSGGTVLDSVSTPLMFYPDGAESQLNFVAAVPLNDVPSRGPDGAFVVEPAAGRPPLEDALGDGGWLARTVGELNRLGGRLRLGIAPTPRLVEEIVDMSNGYRRGDEQLTDSSPEAQAAADFLNELGQLLGTEGVQPLLVPYANPDLPSLAASGIDDHLGTQITLGETILSDELGVDVDRSWIFPGGRANADSLDLLRLASNAGEHTFFSASSLEPLPDPLLAGCPIEALSPACPISVSTQAGETLGYQAEPGLQDRLTALMREDDRLNLQRFFAETAMIRQEQPGRTDRVVQATLPSLWHPRPGVIRTLYRGLARAPWLNTVTPEEGLALDIDPVERRISDDDDSLPNELDPLDYSVIEQAESTIESFNSVGPPAALYQRLLRNYLVAESRSWWIDDELAARGLAYAPAAADEARAEMDKVSIEVSERITLTSRAEDIPVRILNNAGYPVKVRFHLDSTRLRVQDENVQTFETGRTPMTVPVRADSSGFFPVTMALVTPDGSEVIAQSEPTVRSTEFNNVALTITVGALFFLIAFYLLRWYRRRNAPRAQEPA
jgi:hypothetical protein